MNYIKSFFKPSSKLSTNLNNTNLEFNKLDSISTIDTHELVDSYYKINSSTIDSTNNDSNNNVSNSNPYSNDFTTNSETNTTGDIIVSTIQPDSIIIDKTINNVINDVINDVSISSAAIMPDETLMYDDEIENQIEDKINRIQIEDNNPRKKCDEKDKLISQLYSENRILKMLCFTSLCITTLSYLKFNFKSK